MGRELMVSGQDAAGSYRRDDRLMTGVWLRRAGRHVLVLVLLAVVLGIPVPPRCRTAWDLKPTGGQSQRYDERR